MKTLAARALLALATTACFASAADVTVLGAQQTPVSPAAIEVRTASRDILNRPTALLNKNMAATDTTVLIARSNVLKMQNDRLVLAQKVREALETTTTMASDAEPSTTAVLTKNVLRAVSAPTDDTALVTKASAVVTATGDPAALTRAISRFVDSSIAEAQSMQSKSPNSVMLRVGTSDLLRQPTAIVIKNTGLTGNQITITNSTITPTQNDQIVLRGATVAAARAPASVVHVNQTSAADQANESEAANPSTE